jgi:hypothetical protein
VGCPEGVGHGPDYIPLRDQRRWKYALDTDGWGPALRFYKLLGGGAGALLALVDHSARPSRPPLLSWWQRPLQTLYCQLLLISC